MLWVGDRIIERFIWHIGQFWGFKLRFGSCKAGIIWKDDSFLRDGRDSVFADVCLMSDDPIFSALVCGVEPLSSERKPEMVMFRDIAIIWA